MKNLALSMPAEIFDAIESKFLENSHVSLLEIKSMLGKIKSKVLELFYQ